MFPSASHTNTLCSVSSIMHVNSMHKTMLPLRETGSYRQNVPETE